MPHLGNEQDFKILSLIFFKTMATNQQPQQPAPQAPVQQEVHPLSKIRMPNAVLPFAQAFAEPLSTFRQCFNSTKEADMAYLQQVEFAMQAMQANPFLITCAQRNPGALINSLKQVALSGLSLSPVSKQGYLVPFKNEISFMPSYIGLRDLLVKTGLVQNLEARLVYTDDYFEISYGEGGRLVHKPNVFSKNRKKENILGGYFMVTLSSGKLIYDTMSIDELESVHKRSPSFGKQSPWASDYEEMLKKTLVRRGYKSVPHVLASVEQIKIIELALANDNKFFIEPEQNKKPADQSFFEEVQDVQPDNATREPSAEAPTPQDQPQQ